MRNRFVIPLLLTSFIFVLAILIWAFIFPFEGKSPQISWEGVTPYLGKQKTITIDISDPKRGIRKVRLVLSQNGKEFILQEENLPSAGFFSGGAEKTKSMTIDIQPFKAGAVDGKPVLEVSVWDYFFRKWGKGNVSSLRQELLIDTVPPVVSVLANTRYLNQGGAGIVVYKISKEVEKHGVKVDEIFYKGYPVKDHPGAFQALFALPFSSSKVNIGVHAEDMSGNIASGKFPFEIKPNAFRKDVITLTESYLEMISGKATGEFPEYLSAGSPLDIFIAINTKLRKANEDDFKKISANTSPDRLWKGVFTAIPNATARAIFADQRSYQREGNEVTTSVHLGFDMAALEKYPVPAANDGIVAEIKHMGIYGLTLILDHGQGLFSTYSHLSSTEVQKGDTVKKGQTVARTGTSGLAFGDHLHFGIMNQGVFINPTEWIDPNWIQKKIELPLKEAFGGEQKGN